jgi:hypothetical protein
MFTHKYVNGEQIELTSEEIAELEAQSAAVLAEQTANQYKKDRTAEYPSFADQFDLLYHGGYDAWKAAIQTVQDKYPKGA